MKRPVFIIVGVVIVFILLLVWLYMLFINKPQTNTDNFADLNLGDTTDNVDTNLMNDSPLVDVFSPEALRQLNTKNTIGFEEVIKDASSTPEIFYVESGTGNIFSINLETGQEVKISKTTVPNSHKAAVTPRGNYALFQSNLGVNSQFYIGEISSSSDEIILSDFESNIISFESTRDNTFLYAVQTNNSVVAKEYNPVSNKTVDLFTIPFREATINWGEVAEDAHYVYPKASSKLEGYLYKVVDGVLNRLPIDGYGLSAIGNNDYVLFSKLDNSLALKSYTDFSSFFGESLPLVVQPEKCEFYNTESSNIICGADRDITRNLPDAWYQGLTKSSDIIWSVDIVNNGVALLIDPYEITGRDLDITNLEISSSTNTAYFLNKNDSTLWLFDLNSVTKLE